VSSALAVLPVCINKSCDQSGVYTRRHCVNQIRVITPATNRALPGRALLRTRIQQEATWAEQEYSWRTTTKKLYGKEIGAKEIVTGTQEVVPAAEPLVSLLDAT
jgi:hypothetical protein